MKTNIEQQLESAIRDNKSYIKANGGNIREYFSTDYANQDQGQNWYLTDAEIELWENSEIEESRLNNQILDLLSKYDIDIEEYLNETIEAAY